MNKILSWFCYLFLKPIVKLIWIKEVQGVENIPNTNFILASNHQSHWDQVINGYLCVPREFTYLGQIDKYTGFSGFLRNLAYKIGDVIPINRLDENSKKEALKKCIERLRRGQILIMYPEGTRSRDGRIQEGKIGIAKIYLATGKPILPVAIKGNFEIMPTGSTFPKFKKIIKINVGKPLEFKEELEIAKNLNCNSNEYQEICKKIVKEIIANIRFLYEKL